MARLPTRKARNIKPTDPVIPHGGIDWIGTRTFKTQRDVANGFCDTSAQLPANVGMRVWSTYRMSASQRSANKQLPCCTALAEGRTL